ncbi:MAG: 4Fe-4S binding protein [Erysipelotrichaceae bacterium]
MQELLRINHSKCNGCGKCISSCSKGAIYLENGKANVNNDICDHIGKCVSECLNHAIEIENVSEHLSEVCEGECECDLNYSQLYNWPIKLNKAPLHSRYFHQCDLLIAADCTAFAHARLHDEVMVDKITIIACPLDLCGDLFNKLVDIIKVNDIKSLHVAYMHSGCCKDMHSLVEKAMKQAGKALTIYDYEIDVDGTLVQE